MSSNWQSYFTVGIIILTVVIFIWRSIAKRRSKVEGCGQGCGCPSTTDLKKKSDN